MTEQTAIGYSNRCLVQRHKKIEDFSEPEKPVNIAPYIENLPDCIIVRKGPEKDSDKIYTEVECPKCESIILTSKASEITDQTTCFWCPICNDKQIFINSAIKNYSTTLIRAPMFRHVCSIS